ALPLDPPRVVVLAEEFPRGADQLVHLLGLLAAQLRVREHQLVEQHSGEHRFGERRGAGLRPAVGLRAVGHHFIEPAAARFRAPKNERTTSAHGRLKPREPAGYARAPCRCQLPPSRTLRWPRGAAGLARSRTSATACVTGSCGATWPGRTSSSATAVRCWARCGSRSAWA